MIKSSRTICFIYFFIFSSFQIFAVNNLEVSGIVNSYTDANGTYLYQGLDGSSFNYWKHSTAEYYIFWDPSYSCWNLGTDYTNMSSYLCFDEGGITSSQLPRASSNEDALVYDNVWGGDQAIFRQMVIQEIPSQAINVNLSSTSNTTATISWARGSGGYCAAFMKETSSGTATPENKIGYTANTVFGTGSQIGATGWYCVYNGTGTTVNVSGLNAGSNYLVHVCEYDNLGIIVYNKLASDNNPQNAVLPVELTNFTAVTTVSITGEAMIVLNWTTATEVNNYGFDIERSVIDPDLGTGSFQKIGFVQGHGNSNSIKEYSFFDKECNHNNTCKLEYRLKQIDTDGEHKYSDIATISIKGNSTIPREFLLEQNYPNPFNPTTNIVYSLPYTTNVKLSVYDILGKEIAKLVDETQEAGKHIVKFSGKDLSSGIYIYKIQANDFVAEKKLILIK